MSEMCAQLRKIARKKKKKKSEGAVKTVGMKRASQQKRKDNAKAARGSWRRCRKEVLTGAGGRTRRFARPRVGLLAATILVAACSNQASPVKEADGTSVERRVLDLGSWSCTAPVLGSICTPNGTTAYVQSPVGLFTCQAGKWAPILCLTAGAGAVAYASSSETLVACVKGQWTQVTLLTGPQGGLRGQLRQGQRKRDRGDRARRGRRATGATRVLDRGDRGDSDVRQVQTVRLGLKVGPKAGPIRVPTARMVPMVRTAAK